LSLPKLDLLSRVSRVSPPSHPPSSSFLPDPVPQRQMAPVKYNQPLSLKDIQDEVTTFHKECSWSSSMLSIVCGEHYAMHRHVLSTSCSNDPSSTEPTILKSSWPDWLGVDGFCRLLFFIRDPHDVSLLKQKMIS